MEWQDWIIGILLMAVWLIIVDFVGCLVEKLFLPDPKDNKK